MKKLHSGAVWLFRISSYFAFLYMFMFLFIPFFIFVSSFFGFDIIILVFVILIYILFSFAVAEIFSRMSYNRWLYEFGEEQLRIERGIIWKRYSNIPYERVQNIDVRRGVIARILGFSSIHIQTAGYSAPNKAYSEGYIPAVEIHEAEKIREFVIKKIKGKKSGL